MPKAYFEPENLNALIDVSTEVKQRRKVPNKGLHRRSQAERARKLASESGSPLVAELYELHARLCEKNAADQPRRVPEKAPG
jgi:hypothetical protein